MKRLVLTLGLCIGLAGCAGGAAPTSVPTPNATSAPTAQPTPAPTASPTPAPTASPKPDANCDSNVRSNLVADQLTGSIARGHHRPSPRQRRQ